MTNKKGENPGTLSPKKKQGNRVVVEGYKKGLQKVILGQIMFGGIN